MASDCQNMNSAQGEFRCVDAYIMRDLPPPPPPLSHGSFAIASSSFHPRSIDVVIDSLINAELEVQQQTQPCFFFLFVFFEGI